jgi:hypothetical protein
MKCKRFLMRFEVENVFVEVYIDNRCKIVITVTLMS